MTLSRLLAPVVIIPLVLTGNIIFAGISVGIFSLTDLFDGFIARKLNATSEFGRVLDAVTDKIFALSLLIPLAIFNPNFWIMITCELLIGLTNIKKSIEGDNPKTIFIGKVKTALLFSSMVLGYLSNLISLNVNIVNSLILSTGLLQATCISKYNKLDTKKQNTKNDDNKQIIEHKKDENKHKINENKRKYEELKRYVQNLERQTNIVYNQKSIEKIKILKKD